jgi:hemolysin III
VDYLLETSFPDRILEARAPMTLANVFAPDEQDLVNHYPNRAEHAADGIVHAVGLLAGLLGGGVLIAAALSNRGVPLATASAIYALCLMAMLAASAVYNFSRPNAARRVLRRIDEAAIFLMIAGSYTPFTIQLLPPAFALGVTVAIWAAALAGAAGKVFWPHVSDKAWCLVYLAFGWLAVLVLGPVAPTLPPLAFWLLALAGLTYSGGVLLYLNHTLPFRRALWHGCVILGAAGHYGAVLVGLVL